MVSSLHGVVALALPGLGLHELLDHPVHVHGADLDRVGRGRRGCDALAAAQGQDKGEEDAAEEDDSLDGTHASAPETPDRREV
jgi:hypothetical protein